MTNRYWNAYVAVEAARTKIAALERRIREIAEESGLDPSWPPERISSHLNSEHLARQWGFRIVAGERIPVNADD